VRGGPWTRHEIDLLLTLQLVDPVRFVEEPVFRRAVIEILSQSLDPIAPPDLREQLLYELNQIRGVDFAVSEQIEWAWGAIPRRGLEREVAYSPEGFRFVDNLREPIVASLYSLPSSFFSAEEVSRFLGAVRDMAPRRAIVVLSDLPLKEKLEKQARELQIHLVETYGRAYTPWPRDSLSLVRSPQGAVRVLVRPNFQPRRGEDAFLGLELIQNLPPELDREWHAIHWSTAPVPFHNGQILLGSDRAWISAHTLEYRALQLLGLESVSMASFQRDYGIREYFSAIRRAAAELGAFYDRPIRFVHPLPETGSLGQRQRLIEQISGGAGFDLDSILCLVPPTGKGPVHALVGDLVHGLDLLERLSQAEWQSFGEAYDLEPDPKRLGPLLRQAQESTRARRLAAFLDLMSEHLRGQGLAVHRLPLVLVPTELLVDRADLDHQDFLLTWTNVITEAGPGGPRAEGFSSLLPRGDEQARRVFAQAGCSLDLLPSLVRSVVLVGGYRCASNHLRVAARKPS
jgi:hypothetical protein